MKKYGYEYVRSDEDQMELDALMKIFGIVSLDNLFDSLVVYDDERQVALKKKIRAEIK